MLQYPWISCLQDWPFQSIVCFSTFDNYCISKQCWKHDGKHQRNSSAVVGSPQGIAKTVTRACAHPKRAVCLAPAAGTMLEERLSTVNFQIFHKEQNSSFMWFSLQFLNIGKYKYKIYTSLRQLYKIWQPNLAYSYLYFMSSFLAPNALVCSEI